MSNVANNTKVLALKYRPKRFEDLVGQSTISQTLSLALDTDRLSHAYLFSGLRGSGKTSTARIMAKALLCETGPTSKPCETCEHCTSANSNRHLDIIEMDAASNRGIDDIKDLIEHTKYKPSSARFKVFIIDEVHMLTTQAFNALLKTLEEPPGFVKFILATTDALKLPATILSRTQHFRFKKISNKDVIHHLSHILNEENIDFESECLDIIARSGQGSLRDTLTLLDQAIIFSKGKITTTSVVDMLGLIDPAFMDEIFDIVLNKKDINDIIFKLEEYEASSVCDEMSIYLKDKMLSRDPHFDILLFDRFFRILADAKHLLGLNSDASFVMLLSLLKMQEATNIRSIDDLINKVQNVDIIHPIKDAINTNIVSSHAKTDEKHVYENLESKNIAIVKNESQKQIIEKQEEVKQEVEHKQAPINTEQIDATNLTQNSKETIIEDIVSNNTEVKYENPFEEVRPTETIDNTEGTNNTHVSLKTEEAEVTNLTQNSKEAIIEDIVSNNTAVNHANPFDSPSLVISEKVIIQKESSSVHVNENTASSNNNIIEQTKSLEDFLSKNDLESVNTLNEKKVEESNSFKNDLEKNLENKTEVKAEEIVEEKAHDEFKDKFELVINKVYDRDIQLGEVFEENFIYKKFEESILYISSFAQGEERKLLFKHFALLKSFMYDIYGNTIEIEFVKEEVEEQKKKPSELNNEVSIDANVSSMVEDVVMDQNPDNYGSGCVADMHKTSTQSPAQQELQIKDILSSPMLNKAKELFDVRKITVKTKT